MSITPPLSVASENLASRVIDFVRFPLIVLIVAGHAGFDRFAPDKALQNFPVANFFCGITKDGIFHIAVPLFFFISGYLFFLNASSFSREIYFKKLRRRFWTLFVPMAVWGTLHFIFRFFTWKFVPSVFCDQGSFDYHSVSEFLHDFLDCGILAWNLTPFWFIRGLIIACLLSPLWFFLLKKLKVLPVIIFGLWYCLFAVPNGAIPAHSFGAVVVFFFCFGAYFSIHEIDFTKIFSKIRVPLFVVYLFLLIMDATMKIFGFAESCGVNFEIIRNFEMTIGLATAIAFVSVLFEKRPDLRIPKILRDATFFVFAGHLIVLRFVPLFIARLPSLFPCKTSLGIIVAFLGATLFAVVVCVLLSVLVRKFAPWSIRFLTGGR